MNLRNMKKITVRNHFAFGSVFTQDMEVTREFISALIGKEISKVTLAEKEKVIQDTSEGKGKRFDVYLKDKEGESFDLELQICDEESLEKRVRYYQSVMTMDSLLKGEKYRNLKDSYVIFIFTEKDPLKKGWTVYEINNTITNHDNRPFNDGMHSYIFNFSNDRVKTADPLIEEIAQYFYNGDVRGELTGKIDSIVNELNENDSWREKVMTWEQEKEILKDVYYEMGKADVALAMLRKGFDIPVINEITGLSQEKIIELQKEKTE